MSGLAVWKSNKKTLRFVVTFHLEELSSVPFLAGVIFAKLRLLQGGHFTKISDREEIVEHRVCWNSTFTFEAKLTATLSTGILDPCTVRVSVRREAQGGKSHLKLGFADINLAEFAGGTPQSRSFLLEEYNSSARANNALLRVTIHMQVKEGDFCFKVPVASSTPSYFGESLNSVVVKDGEEESVTLIDGSHNDPPVVVPSSASQSSMPAHQTEHSRQSSSSDSGVVREMGSEYGSLERNSGRNSALSGPAAGLLEREKNTSSRVDATRVDPEGLIDQLLRESNLASSPHEGGGGLTLYIGKDGSAAVVGD